MKFALALIAFSFWLFAISSAHAACSPQGVVDCGQNCSWGYNAATDTYYPGSGTTNVAQAAANAMGACPGTYIVVQGTQNYTAAGYANYFFEFIVNSNGEVSFDGNSDVSHDQRPVPPSNCQINRCVGFDTNGVLYFVTVGDPVTVTH